MRYLRIRRPSPAMVVALLALCIALSGSAAAGPVADGAQRVTAQVKKALGIAKKADRRSKQALRLARLPGPRGDTGPQGPKGDRGAAGSIVGALAGGDLTGSFPDPEIAGDAVGSPEIAQNAIGFQELAPGVVSSTKIGTGQVETNHLDTDAVTSPKIDDGAVRAGDLGPFVLRESAGVIVPGGTEGNGNYETREAEVTCGGFAERPIAGGAYWDVSGNDTELTVTQLRLGAGTVSARGGNDSGTDRIFKVQAYCLAF